MFRRDDRIFRSLDTLSHETLRALSDAGLMSKLIDKGRLVETQFVDDPDLSNELAADNPGYERFLEHSVLWPITYPYEWSVSMLADAGVLTLDLQEELVQQGYSLKDATAFNVQFVSDRPTFIDISSIERPNRLDIWHALGQFAQMFTFPLLLTRHRGWDLRSYFVANIGGLRVERLARSLGLQRWRPRYLLDVALPYMLGKAKPGEQRDSNVVLAQKNANFKPQLMNLARVRSKITKLAAGYPLSGVWSTYTDTCTYDDAATRAKMALVREHLESSHPATVLDLGCNTGDYSYLAAECGASVIAADGDHDAIESLYRRLKKKSAKITPMVADLGNPSPALGFRNQEREAFSDRVRCDCVLALALVHHLLVTGNLTPGAVRDLFHDLTRDTLVVEFIPTDDVMFKELLKQRVGPFEAITLETFVRIFEERFDVLRQDRVANSERVLLHMRRRT